MQGYTAPGIALSLSLSRRTCQGWVQRFNLQGLAGLQDQPGRGRNPLLTPQETETFKRRLDAEPTDADVVCTFQGEDFRWILKNEFGKARSVRFTTCCINWDTNRWFRVRSTETRTKRASRLLKKVPRNGPGHRPSAPGETIENLFQDEARFAQQGTLTRVWAPEGSRPRAVRQTQYDYLWVIGVVCPETGQSEGLLSPRLNREMINIFLKQFSKTIPVDEHAVVVWDGAGFHRAKTLKVPGNITLVSLHPYSPELNPIENLWHYLKSQLLVKSSLRGLRGINGSSGNGMAESMPGHRADENRLQRPLCRTRSYLLRRVLAF